ncbi:leucyl/phenylalanyl-tRNA--protein transferase [Shewanella surugensis]|uniref:Leucyl/phenylalanyl-tRNA--protein transferase n=1 Tax=Shewanella surugensis TaxID=212020 RepID=A0ABT0LGI9_9GAMM|nr:leucyl/phenylalanyl-tRNA--protein transferase [Shewanella surugensis]MCL1126779.1 leucyl/phenylalanyl-tRNA--protein transferase [Shewanella surugensis]
MNTLSYLNNDQQPFPPAEQALTEPNGLLAVGGDLRPQRLLNAYYNGIFPWFNNNDPILWWSPDPRAVIPVGQLNISRSLRKYVNKQAWRYTINHAFPHVIQACSLPRKAQEGTWITQDIQDAYLTLHQQGYAHSIEVWHNDLLIGGLYGIAIGQVFCGESMFHLESNASKAAMMCLQQHLLSSKFTLIDAQIVNPHLTSLGAKAISRSQFISQLIQLRDKDVAKHCWEPKEVSIEF